MRPKTNCLMLILDGVASKASPLLEMLLLAELLVYMNYSRILLTFLLLGLACPLAHHSLSDKNKSQGSPSPSNQSREELETKVFEVIQNLSKTRFENT